MGSSLTCAQRENISARVARSERSFCSACSPAPRADADLTMTAMATVATLRMAMRHTHGVGVAGAIVLASPSTIRGKDITVALAIIRSSITVAAALGMQAATASMAVAEAATEVAEAATEVVAAAIVE